MNCSFSHFRVGFKRETRKFPLGMDTYTCRTFISYSQSDLFCIAYLRNDVFTVSSVCCLILYLWHGKFGLLQGNWKSLVCCTCINKLPSPDFLTSCCISLNSAAYFSYSHINAAGKYSPWQKMKCSAELTEFMHKANISERIFTFWPSAVKYTEFWFWRQRILHFQKKVLTFDKKCTYFPKARFSFPPKESPLFSVWNVSAELNCLMRKSFAAWIK